MNALSMGVVGVATQSGPLADCACAVTIDDLVHAIPMPCRVIVPTSRYRMALLRSWARHRPGQVMPQVLTMHRFVQQFVPCRLPVVTDPEAAAVLDLAMQDAGERFRPPGVTIQNLMRWKQEALTPADVARSSVDSSDHLLRIARVWAAYEARMDGVAMDRGDLYGGNGATHGDHVPIDIPVLVLATHGLSASDERFWTSYADRGAQIAIQFAVPVRMGRDRSAEVAQRLTARGWHPVMARQEIPMSAVHLWTAPTPRDEVRGILASIKRLVEQGTPLSRLAIVMPTSSLYSTILRNEAAAAEVPLQSEVSIPLSVAADVAALHAACRVVIDRWTRADVARLVHVCPSINGVDVSMLFPAAVTYRIHGGQGAEQWRTRLQQRLNVVTALESTGELDPDTTDAVHREQRFLLAALRAVRRLESSVHVPDHPMDAQGVVRVLEAIAEALGLQLRDDLRATFDALQSFCTRHAPAPAPFPIQIQRWWSLVQAEQRSVAAAPSDGVAVITASDARLREWDVVFAPGFVHGVRPRLPSDAVDSAVLGDLQRVRDDEDIADILSAALSVVVCSRPSVMDGDDALASTYWDYLCEAEEIPTAAPDHPVVQCVALVNAHRVLLHTGERDAYLDSASFDRRGRQAGVQTQDLTAEAADLMQKLCSRPLSPSRIDVAASCGYRYYAEKVLGLQAPDTVDDTLTNLERGTLVHAIAHRLFVTLQVRALPDDACSARDVQEAMVNLTLYPMEELLRICEEVFHAERKRFPDDYLYRSAEDQAFLDHDRRAGILRKWLQMEQDVQASEDAFYPVAFEVSIEDDIPLPDGRTERVRLRVDRIDARIVHTEHGDVVEARVVDYKTSTAPEPVEIREGRASQMPLYMTALEQWFDRRGCPVTVVEAAYHVIGKSVFSDKTPKVVRALTTNDDHVRQQKLPQHRRDVTPRITPGIDIIREQLFHVSPTAKACTICSASELCRIDDWGPY